MVRHDETPGRVSLDANPLVHACACSDGESSSKYQYKHPNSFPSQPCSGTMKGTQFSNQTKENADSHQDYGPSSCAKPVLQSTSDIFVEDTEKNIIKMNKIESIQRKSSLNIISISYDIYQREIMDNVGLLVYRVPDKYLFEHVLPPLRQGLDTEMVCKGLKRKHILLNMGKGRYRWKGVDMSKKRDDHNSITIGKTLQSIITALKYEANKVSLNRSWNTLDFESGDNRISLSAETNIDAALLLADHTGNHGVKRNWYEIAIPILLNDGEHDDCCNDIGEIVHCMQHMMAHDLCRRFVYGIEFSNGSMHVWFISRSSILVSNGIDLDKDHESVIKIFLSLLYASVSDLGWDPTISTELLSGKRTHTIDVSGTQVVTDATMNISDSKAQNIIGSGTRIYLANRIVDGKKAEKVVLKDVWLEDGRIPEHEIRDQIVNDIADADDQEYVREYILTPIAYGKVKVGDTEDHTEKVMLRGKSPDYSRQYKIPIPPELASNKDTTEVQHENKKVIEHTRRTPQVREDKKRQSYPHRYHYRGLYKEVATLFCNLKNSMDIILVTIDVLETLRRLHEAGWVHRDISGGNIYLYTDPITNKKRGMIGDLEIAKRAEGGARYDVRTGSRDFMAIEIASQGYLFFTFGQYCQSTDTEPDTDTEMRAEKTRDAFLSILKSVSGRKGFFYNYIHDIESVWWVMIWALFTFEKEGELLDRGDTVTRRTNRENLFYGFLKAMDRRDFFERLEIYDNYAKCIPKYFTSNVAALDLVRKKIIKEYRAKEVDNPQSIKYTSPKLHARFIAYLRNVNMESFAIVRMSPDKPEKMDPYRATVDDDEGHSSKKQKCSHSLS